MNTIKEKWKDFKNELNNDKKKYVEFAIPLVLLSYFMIQSIYLIDFFPTPKFVIIGLFVIFAIVVTINWPNYKSPNITEYISVGLTLAVFLVPIMTISVGIIFDPFNMFLLCLILLFFRNFPYSFLTNLLSSIVKEKVIIVFIYLLILFFPALGIYRSIDLIEFNVKAFSSDLLEESSRINPSDFNVYLNFQKITPQINNDGNYFVRIFNNKINQIVGVKYLKNDGDIRKFENEQDSLKQNYRKIIKGHIHTIAENTPSEVNFHRIFLGNSNKRKKDLFIVSDSLKRISTLLIEPLYSENVPQNQKLILNTIVEDLGNYFSGIGKVIRVDNEFINEINSTYSVSLPVLPEEGTLYDFSQNEDIYSRLKKIANFTKSVAIFAFLGTRVSVTQDSSQKSVFVLIDQGIASNFSSDIFYFAKEIPDSILKNANSNGTLSDQSFFAATKLSESLKCPLECYINALKNFMDHDLEQTDKNIYNLFSAITLLKPIAFYITNKSNYQQALCIAANLEKIKELYGIDFDKLANYNTMRNNIFKVNELIRTVMNGKSYTDFVHDYISNINTKINDKKITDQDIITTSHIAWLTSDQIEPTQKTALEELINSLITIAKDTTNKMFGFVDNLEALKYDLQYKSKYSEDILASTTRNEIMSYWEGISSKIDNGEKPYFDYISFLTEINWLYAHRSVEWDYLGKLNSVDTEHEVTLDKIVDYRKNFSLDKKIGLSWEKAREYIAGEL
ncbi:MAG: hypothetical protein JW866_09955 [Ignavibacteriales bacterium]|nr:hypothetical protein [Ignavibacteriales bacterium]